MAARPSDWVKQAEHDLAHACVSLEGGYHEWACFSAQQGAEKAVKALFMDAGGIAWGHSVTGLLGELPENTRAGDDLLEAAKEPDKHYIPARYPNAHPGGAPHDYYTRREAERAVENGDRIVEWCAGLLARSDGGLKASS